jgi:hypothetical protein
MKYPKIKAEGAIFREQFINPQFVADNGVTVTGSPVINNGMPLNGTSQYATLADEYKYSFGNSATDKPFSVEAWVNMTDATSFVIASKGVNNVDAEWLFYVASSDKVYFQLHDESVADCRLGRAYNTALTSFEGQMIHLVATYDGSSTEAGMNIYLNGVQVDDVSVGASQGSYVAMEKQEHDVWIGRYSTTYANGVIGSVTIYDKELSGPEVLDKFTQNTFLWITPTNSEIWLPLRSHYYDSGVTKEVTPNLGNVNSDQVVWGDGSTTTTYPTLLENNGVSMDGGDFIDCGTAIDFSRGFSFFCLFNVSNFAADRTLLAGTFDDNSMVDVQVDTTGILQSSFYDGGSLYGASSTAVTGGWHSCCFVKYAALDNPAIYLDGVLQGGTTIAAINSATGMFLGKRTDGSDGFVGSMKFPIIFPCEITETQAGWLHSYMFRQINT